MQFFYNQCDRPIINTKAERGIRIRDKNRNAGIKFQGKKKEWTIDTLTRYVRIKLVRKCCRFVVSNRRGLINFFTRCFPKLLFYPQLPQLQQATLHCQQAHYSRSKHQVSCTPVNQPKKEKSPIITQFQFLNIHLFDPQSRGIITQYVRVYIIKKKFPSLGKELLTCHYTFVIVKFLTSISI